MLDTLLNVASFKAIVKICEHRSHRDYVIEDSIAQGDDIPFCTRKFSNACDIIEVYREVGYDVHPEKTYISRARAEFLRKSYEKGRLSGYRARSILNIMYRNPIKEPELIKPMRLYSRISVWNLLILRGGDPVSVGRMMLEDARQAGVEKHHAVGFCLLPSAI